MTDSMADIDVSNSQGVGVQGFEKIIVLWPRTIMSKQDALRHAAWIVALADDNDEFPAVLAAVRST